MILVTGATGTVGSEVVEQLVAAGARVRVLARDPAKAAKFGPSVEVVRGDLTKPETLDAAFAGVEKAFLLATGPELVQLEGNALAAAKKASVKHIVKLSASGIAREPELQLRRWHREGEEQLKASGLAWTILLPGNFDSNALGWAHSIKAQGMVFHLSGNGPSAPIDPRDIAAVAVAALTQPGHEGKAYTLTGPEALTTAEQVQIISAALGKPLQAIDAPEAAARGGMLGQGMPEALVDAVIELMVLIKAGLGGTLTSTVDEVLGRKGRTFEAWVKDNVAAFR